MTCFTTGRALQSLAVLMLATPLALPTHVQAQTETVASYPTQAVRFVVPFSAGGGTDVIMRLIARHMGEAWKVSVIVDNRVGAGGVVGSQHVTQQKPDGRTFLAVASAFAVRAAIDRNLPYDVNKDFTGVGQMARSPSFMVVSPSHGFGSLKELIAYAKKEPKGILYGSAGVGSTAHMHAAAVAHLAKIKADHVAFRGTPEAVNDAMAGRVLYAFAPGPNAIPLARAGKLRDFKSFAGHDGHELHFHVLPGEQEFLVQVRGAGRHVAAEKGAPHCVIGRHDWACSVVLIDAHDIRARAAARF